jgi:hypothetical protein
LAEEREYPCGDGGTEDQLSVGDGLEPAGDLCAVRALEKVPAGAGAHGCENRAVLVDHGEDEDRGLRPLGENLAGRFDAVEDGHVKIHDHHVRLE